MLITIIAANMKKLLSQKVVQNSQEPMGLIDLLFQSQIPRQSKRAAFWSKIGRVKQDGRQVNLELSRQVLNLSQSKTSRMGNSNIK